MSWGLPSPQPDPRRVRGNSAHGARRQTTPRRSDPSPPPQLPVEDTHDVLLTRALASVALTWHALVESLAANQRADAASGRRRSQCQDGHRRAEAAQRSTVVGGGDWSRWVPDVSWTRDAATASSVSHHSHAASRSSKNKSTIRHSEADAVECARTIAGGMDVLRKRLAQPSALLHQQGTTPATATMETPPALQSQGTLLGRLRAASAERQPHGSTSGRQPLGMDPVFRQMVIDATQRTRIYGGDTPEKRQKECTPTRQASRCSSRIDKTSVPSFLHREAATDHSSASDSTMATLSPMTPPSQALQGSGSPRTKHREANAFAEGYDVCYAAMRRLVALCDRESEARIGIIHAYYEAAAELDAAAHEDLEVSCLPSEVEADVGGGSSAYSDLSSSVKFDIQEDENEVYHDENTAGRSVPLTRTDAPLTYMCQGPPDAQTPISPPRLPPRKSKMMSPHMAAIMNSNTTITVVSPNPETNGEMRRASMDPHVTLLSSLSRRSRSTTSSCAASTYSAVVQQQQQPANGDDTVCSSNMSLYQQRQLVVKARQQAAAGATTAGNRVLPWRTKAEAPDSAPQQEEGHWPEDTIIFHNTNSSTPSSKHQRSSSYLVDVTTPSPQAVMWGMEPSGGTAEREVTLRLHPLHSPPLSVAAQHDEAVPGEAAGPAITLFEHAVDVDTTQQQQQQQQPVAMEGSPVDDGEEDLLDDVEEITDSEADLAGA